VPTPSDAPAASASSLPLLDLCPETDTFRDEVLAGLRATPKRIPSKFLYDRRGSRLFDAITELDAYYPTRTEMSIMERSVGAMTRAMGAGVLLVEYGSGSSLKTRILLDHLEAPSGYVPVDISRAHLVEAAEAIAEAYPGMPVRPVCADYTAAFTVPDVGRMVARRVAYYPGSTIGNFRPPEAEAFLARVAEVVRPGGGLLIGVDLRKDPDVLRRAYDDPEGVTARFNLNLLRRLNRELGADFNLGAFHHEARWDDDAGCIEMHLVSETEQTVTVGGEAFDFEEGETIHTEYSYKYTLDGFAERAARAGWRVDAVWTDERDYFSVQFLSVPPV
jgi:dimethylhistidine N-methyltransferase